LIRKSGVMPPHSKAPSAQKRKPGKKMPPRQTFVGGYTNAAGASPMVFSVMENLVSDAWQMRSASEKSVLVTKTVVYTTKINVLIVETMVAKPETIFSLTGKMVSVVRKIFSFASIVV
jgi:hypothetical protein